MVWHELWTRGKTMRRRVALACVAIATLVTLVCVEHAAAQSNVTGQWSVLPYTMPINPIHVGLMRTGKILIVSGTQNDPTVTTNSAAVYDPNTGVINVQEVPWDLFCNGLSWMPDGRALIAGGTLQYPVNGHGWGGLKTTTVFDPATESFIQVQDMARGRWYPSIVGLADGRMATFSGWLEQGGTNNAVEIYTNPNGWSPEFYAPFTPELYPWLHLLPDGRVFMSGANVGSSIFNPSTNTWQTGVATMKYSRDRIYGSSVLLPLSATDNWRARVMIMGGDNPSTATAEIIDLSQASPAWRFTNPMSGPRIQMDAVILPTGKLLALGGSQLDKTASTATLAADLFDPATETWTPAGTMNMPRLYHSVALLLPDGTVWSAGGNPDWGNWENRMEIYRPAYLFNASGGPATRPTITAAPSVIGYGGSFQVSTPNAASIASVALIRNGANTHAFDMDQRMVSLSFTRGAGTLTVTAPPNANIAPPGYYMLFIVDANGVPSVAPFVRVAANPSNQPPRGRIDAPAGDVTISAGQSVNFAGSGTDADGAVSAYRWIFPGGSPATSTSATPGNVTFSTPGTYYVSLTVTDNQGGTDPSPPVRVITVQSGALTASFTSPADGATVNGSVSVGMSASGAGGGSATFTLTVDGQQAFSNTTTGTTQTYPWDTRSVADGVHTLGLSVRDATGATATATRTVTVNNNAPPGTLQVTFPNIVPGQTVRGTLAVQIVVAGASGTNNRFTVFVDGVQQTVIATNTTSVTWNWNTTTASNGSRTISASVQDATGNTGSGFTYVQVQNPTFQVFITQPTNGAGVTGAAVWTTMWVEGAAPGSKTFTLSIGGRNLASTSDTSNGPVTLPWDSRQVTNGTQTLKAVVTDSAGAAGSTTIQVNVQNSGPGPLGADFSSPASGATVSGTVSVGMIAAGGTAPYTYTLTIDGTQVVSSGANTYSWNTGGYSNTAHTLGLTVRDNTGATATATRTVTVQNGGPTPLSAAFTTPADGALVNGTISVGMGASGGTAPYTYTLTIDGTQVVSSGAATYSWNTLAYSNAAHTLGLTVRDATGATATAARTVTVQNNTGTISVFITQPVNGATVTGTVWVVVWIEKAAAGTRAFTLTAGGQTVATTNDTSSGPISMPWITTSTANGPTTVTVSVRDASNNTGTGSIQVNVQNSGPGPLGADFSSPASGATVSGTVSVGMIAAGGTAPYTYTLTIDGTQVVSSGANTYSWNTGGYSNTAHTLGLTVRDNTGATATATRTVTVQNGGPTPLSAAFTTPADGALVNGTISVGMAASGGTAPYTYTLTIDGTQVVSSGATTYSWNTLGYSNAAHTLGLTVRDATGATATATRTVTVQNGGGTLTVALTSPSPGATVRGTVWVTIWVDGGAAGAKSYTMTVGGTTVWSESNADRPASLPWVTTGGTNGTKTLVVTVRDSAGATGTASVTVTVSNP
ncbi:MAG TPA: Ig-like domain-containing protein [Methylomirabilota bacterium]